MQRAWWQYMPSFSLLLFNRMIATLARTLWPKGIPQLQCPQQVWCLCLPPSGRGNCTLFWPEGIFFREEGGFTIESELITDRHVFWGQLIPIAETESCCQKNWFPPQRQTWGHVGRESLITDTASPLNTIRTRKLQMEKMFSVSINSCNALHDRKHIPRSLFFM